ncbi:MAG: hypothetical protein IRZ28_16335 [Steroidobacteraceae bacterium]|nr:hypothetical protein [Steroidobacteraceae bacterium]
MKGQVRGGILIIAASALAACASKAPVDPAPTDSGATLASPTAAAPSDTSERVAKTRALTGGAEASATASADNSIASSRKYRRVVKNGEEYFCRREGVTGSRVQSVMTCLTKAQLAAEVANNQEIMRRFQSGPREAPLQTTDPVAIMTERSVQ